MAHPAREHLWVPLAEKIGLSVTLDEVNDRWDTGRRSLLAFDPQATHHLVLQDDAVIPHDLLEGIAYWLERLPESVLCLYSGRWPSFRQIHRRYAVPPCFLQMKQVQWGVALVLPAQYLEPIVKHGDTLTNVGNYDMRISNWCVRNELPVLYPQMSWVDHRETPSLVPGRSARRHALAALGPEESVLTWSQGKAAPIIPVPEFHRRPKASPYVSPAKRRVR